MLNLLSRAFASMRSQKGLFHGKDIHTGYSYTFSHKATKRTFKPNVHKKNLWSDTLKRSLEIEVSTKALKCIRKAGSLDKYLLTTNTQIMRSQFGETLKSIIQQKQTNPDFQVPYIPRSWKKPKRRNALAKKWHEEAIFRPVELRNTDYTLDTFNVYDPNAPPMEFITKKTKTEETKITDIFSPSELRVHRRLDEDTQEVLDEKIETARAIGIDEEDNFVVPEKKAQKVADKKVRKSRSRQLFEAKMNKIEKRISGGDDMPDTKLIKELKEDILRLKGVKK